MYFLPSPCVCVPASQKDPSLRGSETNTPRKRACGPGRSHSSQPLSASLSPAQQRCDLQPPESVCCRREEAFCPGTVLWKAEDIQEHLSRFNPQCVDGQRTEDRETGKRSRKWPWLAHYVSHPPHIQPLFSFTTQPKCFLRFSEHFGTGHVFTTVPSCLKTGRFHKICVFLHGGRPTSWV